MVQKHQEGAKKMKKKIKLGDFPSLISLAEQYLKSDQEEKQIIWLEIKDLCKEQKFTAYEFFDTFCENRKIGPYEVAGKKKQKKFSKKDLRKRNKERG
tara:strand:+ start:3053 stop:3346 length:294 start_codon:yes stop_codon:yes gene_type:complete